MFSPIFLILVTFLVLNDDLSYGYGTKTTETPTPPPYQTGGEQWGGRGPTNPGEYATNNRESDRYTGNGNQHQGSSEFGSSRQANFFARAEHIERYGHPEGCVRHQEPEKACNYFVEIQKEKSNPDSLHIEISGHLHQEHGYVGMGFSKDKFMGQDLMFECVREVNGNMRLFQSWSRGRSTPHRFPDDPAKIQWDDRYPQFEEKEKVLICKFWLPIALDLDIEGSKKHFDFEQDKYFILIATGNVGSATSDSIGYHGDKPLDSGTAYVSKTLLGSKEERYPIRIRHDDHDSSSSWGNGSSGQHFSLSIGAVIFVFSCLIRIVFL